MELGEMIEVKLFRFDPTIDREPRYENYQVPYRSKMRILGALRYISNELGVEFAYRDYCGNNRCGCCGVKVNGTPMLACWEPVQAKMTIEPLDNLKLVKDLLVDRTELEEAIERQNPRMVRRIPYAGFPEEISHRALLPVFKLVDCIECGLCTSACPAVRERGFQVFSGPSAYVKLALRALDPRDEENRTSSIVDHGIFNCTSCMSCTEVCPQGVDAFRNAVEPLKRIAIAQKAYKGHRHISALKEVIQESGDVNPVDLMKKARGIWALKDLALGVKLGLKGKLQISRPENPGLKEIQQTIAAVEAKK